ncbi:MAG: hypothetical protein FD143_237 [Ignavibacteria bacterium]|nr:MAG: hypothetical protein FD143_237 [Ignavibacteria bacterium]KAF0162074.1 MAG: hypothetical protein FD188_323 [Ignavibacteria bacterium]
MINKLTCNNCGVCNPIFALYCSNCNSFLRARVPNIDLWDTVWNLFVSPTETAVKIIQAEKKNFVFFLLSLWFIKSSINYYILSNYLNHDVSLSDAFLKGGLLSIGVLTGASFLLTEIFKMSKIQVRHKDILAIYTYSLTPIILAFVFLTPFHIALYGFYWYTINPPPLIIKPLVSYVLYGIEFLFYLWVLLLLVLTTYVQIGGRKITSLIIGVIIFLIIFGYQLLIS